jgi:hypothetical protein
MEMVTCLCTSGVEGECLRLTRSKKGNLTTPWRVVL